MWHRLLFPVLIPTLIIKSNCDVNKTDADVFVRYAGHAEADYSHLSEPSSANTVTIPKITTTTTAVKITTAKKYTTPHSSTKLYEDATDNVLFIPNKKPVVRKEEEEYDGTELKIKDIMMTKSVNDAMNMNFHVETDAPNEDIVFISGKNTNFDTTKTGGNARRSDNDNPKERIEDEITTLPTLDCTDLDCNNTINSVCGIKLVNKEYKYRLFLNLCYFQKVNCGFKYEVNRYKLVILDKCSSIGGHLRERPYSLKPRASIIETSADKGNPASKIVSSRRSMTMNTNGQICSHPCPVSCPEDYDPQCAVSASGRRQVFLNHCKLDQSSCFYSIVWHKRPLTECVGGKKADMRQNRGFIGWMQRVGIVDNKGRLVLE